MPLEGSSYGRLAETSLPARCKTIHYRVTFDPKARAVHYATLSWSRTECPTTRKSSLSRTNSTIAFEFFQKPMDETKIRIIKLIKYCNFRNNWCDVKTRLPISRTDGGRQPGIEIAKRDAFQLSNSSNNQFTSERVYPINASKKRNNERRSRKLIIRAGKDDNYSRDKSRDQREQRLPLVRKMAARLGKWLRSIPRNIMQRGRWEVAWSCCFLPVYNERDNGTDS